MKKRTQPNPKRKLRAAPTTAAERQRLVELALRARYGGNSEHKRDPGDFDLTPPSGPRPGKTLCDGVRIFQKAVALRLLQEGMRRGLVSLRERQGWPQNVWALTDEGTPLEGELENAGQGVYHGYPLLSDDSFGEVVRQRWESS